MFLRLAALLLVAWTHVAFFGVHLCHSPFSRRWPAGRGIDGCPFISQALCLVDAARLKRKAPKQVQHNSPCLPNPAHGSGARDGA